MSPADRFRKLLSRRDSAGSAPVEPAPVATPQDLERRERLERILDAMSDAVLVVEGSGRVALANPAAHKVLGVPSDALVGTSLRKTVGSAGLDRVLAQAAKSGQEVEDEVELVWPRRRRLLLRAVPLSHAEGVLAIAADVTKPRRVERMRRDFVANVSHELRTPVSALLLLAESLKSALDSDDIETARRFAGRLVVEAERLRDLSADLLSLSRVESKGATATDEIDLVEMVDSVLDRLRPEADRKGVALERTPADVRVKAVGGRDDYQALIQNLLDNAVRYTDVGRVQVTVAATAGGPILEIKDTGTGIPAADLPRVFERFYRVEKSRGRDSGGTGLGLSIVRHIADAYGLSLDLKSKEDVGTTVSVTFPAAHLAS